LTHLNFAEQNLNRRSSILRILLRRDGDTC